MRPLTRRFLTVAALTATLGASLAGCDKKQAVSADDMSLGNANAKVTVVEYASVACPHCAKWNAEVFPAFKTKYIDTGRIHYVARESLTGDPRLAAAGYLIARCAGKDKYFQVVDALYRAQERIYTSGDIRGELQGIALAAGLNETQFNACVNDEKALKALNDRVDRTAKQDNITGTPTFIVNGKKVHGDDGGEASLAELDTAIAAAEAGAK